MENIKHKFSFSD